MYADILDLTCSKDRSRKTQFGLDCQLRIAPSVTLKVNDGHSRKRDTRAVIFAGTRYSRPCYSAECKDCVAELLRANVTRMLDREVIAESLATTRQRRR